MNRCIYCDDNISIWEDGVTPDVRGDYNIVNNKTRELIMTINGWESSNYGLPVDIQAAFNLYDKDGNIEHIMPKEE